MNALATYRTGGNSPPALSPAVEAILDRLTVEHWKSLRVDNPEDFTNLPSRFVLIRRAGAWWLTDTAYHFEPRRDDRP